MFPAYLGTAMIGDSKSQNLQSLEGHCFVDINIMTSFQPVNEDGEMKIKVNFLLRESLGLCLESLQISTAFSDSYDFYLMGGSKVVELTFTDEAEIADIKHNGLRFFAYCADPFSFLQSSVKTAFMWMGGGGENNYIPTLGEKPTVYQED